MFTIPRPSREATRQILARYLNAELPYGEGADADSLIHAAVAYLHAPEGGAGCLARTTLSDAAEGEVRAPDVLSGSLLASAVARAKHTAAQRALEGGDGLLADDVLAALDDALRAEARKLESPAAARALLDVPRAGDIVRVRLPRERRLRRHRYLRSA